MEKKGRKKGTSKKMKADEDERFANIGSDPRFEVLPAKKRKVVVDERFKSMLSDKKFSSRSAVDMRGRSLNLKIHSVTIYLSDYGKERLEEEEKEGPKLPDFVKAVENGAEMDNRTREALRAYELARMRYYYAIIECDSDKTASAIYESCDGVEFENSSIHMDLRFVPDEMTFEKEMIKDRATEDSISFNSFKPKNFQSAALSSSSSKLTWDETDPERIKTLRQAFDPKADLEEFEHLVAPASSDEEELSADNKAKVLLEAAITKNKGEQDKLEVTWEQGLQPSSLQPQKSSGSKEPTHWEKYLEKRRLKRKERRARITELKEKQKQEAEDVPTHNVSVSRSKKKSYGKKQINDVEINDERFAELYTNSAFAIDQANPLYKPTSLVMKQVSEKQKGLRNKGPEDDSSFLVERLKKKAKRASESKNSVISK
ncbi:unnamed protein product [Enterobius vermicularis]|uniref:NUC153 domain-containing protein n=1 Tax=Enterobius vermicularis TaxID=51028 RepID=A0A0N4VEN1_ENTVE|nr:unnamed protein product [Enterobius vermicularis]